MNIITDEAVEALLPCPFCGSRTPRLHTNSEANMSWVACHECGLEAPTETGVCAGDAVAYWNRRALPHMTAVNVKPLVWQEFWDRSEANSTIGDYIIMPRRDGAFDWRLDGVVSCWASSSGHAKAAAQADYERRIMSDLSSPAPEAAKGKVGIVAHVDHGKTSLTAAMLAAQAKSFAENDAANRGPRHAILDAALQPETMTEQELLDSLDAMIAPHPTPETAEKLDRHSPKTTTAGRDGLPMFMGMEPDQDGAWVRQSDALSIIEKLRAENERLQIGWDSACNEAAECYGRQVAAEARLAEAVEALRPFAEVLTRYSFTEHQLVLLSEDNPKGRRLAHLRPEDFGAATAFLQSLGKEG